VFSTKDRQKLITSNLRDDLYGYLGGIIKNLAGVALAIGGIEDHVHILAGLMATHRLDHLMRELKASSSGWVRRERNPKFAWQSGYGAFAVSAGNLPKVKSYIHNQFEHHKGKDFKTEYVELLELGRVEYDEKYLW
jgi:REP element-mobilizing transposase RayT